MIPGMAGSDFSWLLGILVGAGVYAVLAAPRVRREAAETPPLAEQG